MTQVDKILKLKITRNGPISFEEFYLFLKGWVKKQNYSLKEKNYSDTFDKNKKTTNIGWEASKDIDDYNKFIINIKLSLKDYTTHKKDDKTIMKGALTLDIDSQIKTDYEDKWTKGPFNVFLRSIYDKFITRTERQKLEKEIEENIRNLYSESKDFLGSLKEKE